MSIFYNFLQLFLPGYLCNRSIDLGIVVNYYNTVLDEVKEGQLRDYVISLASEFDIAATSTLLSYIPFSTNPGDFDVNQWFNNTVVKSLASGDKQGQKVFLENLVMPDREGARGNENILLILSSILPIFCFNMTLLLTKIIL